MAILYELPSPKFEHYERVVVVGVELRCKQWQGEHGIVIALDSSAVRRMPSQPDKWLYIVHLPAKATWKTFFQSDLASNGGVDSESSHVGNRPEISFDTLMEQGNEWTEASYRLPCEIWKIAIFRKDDVPEIQCNPCKWQRPTKWEREIMGVVFRFPRIAKLGQDDILRAMSHYFEYTEWVQVDGPDSLMLR